MEQNSSGAIVLLSTESLRLLQRCREWDHSTLQSVLARAIDHYDRHRFFEQADAAYVALRADPEAWAYELAERQLWEVTLLDRVEPEDGE